MITERAIAYRTRIRVSRRVTRIHVDGQTFVLTPGRDVPALKQAIVLALQQGGGFVDFESIGRGLISVLMTSSLPVRFESVERTEDQIAVWEEHPPTIEDDKNLDIDHFFETFDH